MMATFPRVVVPGDSVELPESPDTVIKLGPGLRLHAEDNNSCAIVTTAGVLRHREPNDYWVDITSKRPLAAQGELVIGIVTNNPGENYQVDIGTPASARLNGLAFEAATRRNRPRLEVHVKPSFYIISAQLSMFRMAILCTLALCLQIKIWSLSSPA
eukprot:m.18331 g.18331  ORF g.18331 m.18331 type:complete len:157 (-) comp10787_c0_seq1:344-814(-)